jgi:hypothetical protein
VQSSIPPNIEVELMHVFEYPVTRPILLSRCALATTIILCITFVGIVTLVNIIAVGYELVPIAVTSVNYNSTQPFWYEHIIPTKWIPQRRTCQPAIIHLNEGFFYSFR